MDASISTIQANSEHFDRSDPILPAVLSAQARHTLFRLPDHGSLPVVIGVSGGADSVCLLHVLLQLATLWPIQPHIAHLDHSLRPYSDRDAEFVAQLAERWQVPLHSCRLEPGYLARQAQNVEAAARQARYAFLGRVAREITPASQLPTVAVAHHADDQAETLLMNLLRGSGLAGLAGMTFVREWEAPVSAASPATVRIVRPFLNVRRTQIRRYLNDHGLPWREDPSNRDRSLLRNRLRHEILPQLRQLNPNLIDTLGRTAAILAAETERAERLDREALASLRGEAESGTEDADPRERLVLRLDSFQELDVATQRGLLRQALQIVQPSLPPERQVDDVQSEQGRPVQERPDYEQIETLRYSLLQADRASGPHPLGADVAWTIAPPRFSLHRSQTLPFQPDHPFLDSAWRQAHGRLLVPVPGAVAAGCWRLQVEVIDREHLPADWRSRTRPWRAFLDAERVGALALTTPVPGQRFAPLGMDGQHKTLGDFFTDRKVAAVLRPGWPLLVDTQKREGDNNGEIVWVCGLQPAHPARIRAQTRRVLYLQWESIEE